MAATRRVQILMEPDEYADLARVAERRGASVGAVIRDAVRSHLQQALDERVEAVERITSMNLQVGDWTDLKRDIEEGYDAGLP
jgi:hypothetical protein